MLWFPSPVLLLSDTTDSHCHSTRSKKIVVIFIHRDEWLWFHLSFNLDFSTLCLYIRSVHLEGRRTNLKFRRNDSLSPLAVPRQSPPVLNMISKNSINSRRDAARPVVGVCAASDEGARCMLQAVGTDSRRNVASHDNLTNLNQIDQEVSKNLESDGAGCRIDPRFRCSISSLQESI